MTKWRTATIQGRSIARGTSWPNIGTRTVSSCCTVGKVLKHGSRKLVEIYAYYSQLNLFEFVCVCVHVLTKRFLLLNYNVYANHIQLRASLFVL